MPCFAFYSTKDREYCDLTTVLEEGNNSSIYNVKTYASQLGLGLRADLRAMSVTLPLSQAPGERRIN